MSKQLFRLPQYAFYLLIFSVGFATLGVIDFFLFALTPWRFSVFVSLLALMLYIFLNKYRFSNPHPINILILFFISIFIFYAFLSLLWAESLVLAIRYIFLIILGCLSVFLSMILPDPKKTLNGAFTVWCVSASFFILFAISCFFYDYQMPSSRYYGILGYPPTGFFYNQNNFAVYIAISSVFISNRIISPVSWFQRFAFIGILLLLIYLLYEIDSQGGIATFAFSTIIFFMLKFGKGHVVRGLQVLLALTLLGVLFVYFNDWAFYQFNTLYEKATGSARTDFLLTAWRAARETSLLGVGPGQIELFMGKVSVWGATNIHNWMGEILGNFGLPGLIAWLSILCLMFIGLLRAFQRSTTMHNAFSLLLSLLITFPIWSSVVSSLIGYTVFWTILALICLSISIDSVREE